MKNHLFQHFTIQSVQTLRSTNIFLINSPLLYLKFSSECFYDALIQKHRAQKLIFILKKVLIQGVLLVHFNITGHLSCRLLHN